MQITLKTSGYNDRRYSRPWIAKVDFSDPRGTFEFGQWIGANGEAGELIVDATPGDIVAEGQKDFRKPSNSSPNYRVVKEDGTLGDSLSKVDAYRAWKKKNETEIKDAGEICTGPQAAVILDAAKHLPTITPIDLSNIDTETLFAELRKRGAIA